MANQTPNTPNRNTTIAPPMATSTTQPRAEAADTPTTRQAPPAAQSGPMSFYSRSSGLVININPGREVVGPDNRVTRAGQKHARFNPIGGKGAVSHWGVLTTDDPEIIEALLRRTKVPNTDIFTYDKFMELSQSPAAALQDKNRIIEQQNRLIAELRAKAGQPA